MRLWENLRLFHWHHFPDHHPSPFASKDRCDVNNLSGTAMPHVRINHQADVGQASSRALDSRPKVNDILEDMYNRER